MIIDMREYKIINIKGRTGEPSEGRASRCIMSAALGVVGGVPFCRQTSFFLFQSKFIIFFI